MFTGFTVINEPRQEIKLYKKTFLSLAAFVILASICAALADFAEQESYNWLAQIPFLNHLLLITIFATIYYSWTELGKDIPVSAKAFILTVSLAISTLIWLAFSYETYHMGVMAAVRSSKEIVISSCREILLLNLPEAEKKSLLAGLSPDESLTDITIKKNGVPYFSKSADPSSIDNVREEVFTDLKLCEADGDTYTLDSAIYSKPAMLTSLLRAITFSVFRTSYEIDNGQWYDSEFLAHQDYRLSMNFYTVFLPFLVFFSWLTAFQQRLKLANLKLAAAKQATDETNRALTLKNLELKRFELTYNKIEQDFRAVVSNSQNNLQHALSDFDQKEDSPTMEKIYQSMAGLGRHDIINRINSLPNREIAGEGITAGEITQAQALKVLLKRIEDDYGTDNIKADLYNFILKPWVKEIQTELRGLEGTLSMAIEPFTILEILEQAKKAIPENVGRAENAKSYLVTIADDLTGPKASGKKCLVNLNKIRSMVFNLISNSNRANDEQKTRLRQKVHRKEISKEEFKSYRPTVWIDIRQAQNRLCLSVRDNGGGFPPEILDKIYKEPVPTTKDNREHGEGTAYIGFFAKLMNIEITATNEQGGASTTLGIPFIAEGSDNA